MKERKIQGRKVLYQIGEGHNAIVFSEGELDTTIAKSVKVKIVENPYGDGGINLTGRDRDFLSDRFFQVDCVIDRHSVDIFNKVLYTGGLQKIFWLSKLDNGDYEVFWNYGKITGGLDDKVQKEEDFDFYDVPVSFILSLKFPYYFQFDQGLYIQDKNTFGGVYPLTWGDPNINFGQAGIAYGVLAPNYLVDLSTTTLSDRQTYFNATCSNETKEDNDIYSLTANDYFFGTLDLNNMPTFSKAKTVTVLNPFELNTIYTEDTDLDLKTSELSRYFIIKIDPSVGNFFSNPGEYIEIYNNRTNSGFRLTWTEQVYGTTTIWFNTYNLQLINVGNFQYKLNEQYVVENDKTGRDYLFAMDNLLLDEQNDSGYPMSQQSSFEVRISHAVSVDISIINLKTFL